MQIRCTIVGPHGEQDVRISAPAGTRLRTVAGELAALCDGGGPVLSGGGPVAGDASLGAAPLLEGVRLSFLPEPSGAGERTGAGLPTVRVVGGPAAGAVHPVAAGRWRIGRGEGADIRLDADPAVSRRHALLVVHPHGAVVRDTGSTNGSRVDGAPVEPVGTPLSAGSLLQVGDTTLCFGPSDAAPAAVRATGDGFLRLNRPPRLVQPEPDVEVPLPAPPDPPQRTRLPVASIVLPLALGGALACWQPQFALFMLLSPLMLAVNLVADRANARRGHRRRLAEHADAAATAAEHVQTALTAEAAARRRAAPDPAALAVAAGRREARLWERRPRDADFLAVRLGTADAPARLTVRQPDGTVGHPRLQWVPVTVALRDAGALGLAGPPQQVDALTRSLVGQIATLHSPSEVEITVLSTRADDHWAWVRWLPHLRRDGAVVDVVGPAPGAIAARIAQLLDRAAAAGRARTGRAPVTVVVLDDARQVHALPGAARLLSEGPAAGLFAVCVTGQPGDLPAECAATAVLGTTGVAGLRLAGAVDPPVSDATADLVSVEWADRLARDLAPLLDATPTADSGLPRTTGLLDLLGLPEPDAEEIAARWRARPRCTEVIVGVSASGPYAVDLRADGPHGLIAGTTGAGKSRLLQTLVAALAAGNRPDELAFVLVDYKGGAAFADCARLPHTAGVVTDLDGQLTRRALASLEAELRRRERILAAAGCPDLENYQRVGSPDGPVPRLVLAIDEFAALVEELPDFVAGLVDVARRGRSLGLHLLLATQRPSGVVSAEIRANTALRIALRVTDAGDSQDVLDTAHAATISADLPGRAYCRAGAAVPVQIQVAHLGPRPLGQDAAVRVELHDWRSPAAPTSREGAADEPTDLARLVDAIRTAADRLGSGRPHSPWLPPLPRTLCVDQLCRGPAGDQLAAPAGQHRLAVGLQDLPASQAQRPYEFDLAAARHLVVAGGPRSGRTTLLRTLAGAAGRLPVDDVHLYLLDCAGGGLLPAGQLPHTGAAVGADDAARGARVLDRLAAEVARRHAMLAMTGHAALAEYRSAQPRENRPPWLVLLIDGWPGFVAGYDIIDHGRPVDTVLQLLREGAAAGLSVVVTGGRDVLTGRLASLVPERLVLPLADPADYALAGIPPRERPAKSGAGRGLVAGDAVTEVQVALLHPDPSGAAQAAALRCIAAEARATACAVPKGRLPWRVEPLPADVPYDPPDAKVARPLHAALGVAGDEASPVDVDLGRFGPGFLVAGPRGSGRTTTLATMAASLAACGTEVAIVAPPGSTLAGVAAIAGRERVHGPFAPDAEASLAATLSLAAGPVCVLVDDAAAVADSAVEEVLVDLLRSAATRPAAVVLAGTAEELAGRYRGVAAEARKSGSGVLLNPAGPLCGDLLGVAVSRGHPRLPGRGLLCLRGTATPVQVARLRAAATRDVTPCADSASLLAG